MKNRLKSILQGSKYLAQKLRAFGSGGATSTPSQEVSTPSPEEQKPVLVSDKLVQLSDIDTTHNKDLLKELKSELALQSKAVSTGGLYNILEAGISPIEQKIRLAAQDVGGQIVSSVLRHLNAAEGMLNGFLEHQGSKTDKAVKINFLALHNAEKAAEKAVARKPLIKVNGVERQRRNTKDNKEKYFQQKAHVLKTVYNGLVPEKLTPLTKGLFFGLILMFGVGEGIFIYDSIGRMADNELSDFFRLIVTIVLMLGLIVSAHKLGQELNVKSSSDDGSTQKKYWQKYLPALFYAVIATLLFAGVCYIRFSTIPTVAIDSTGFSQLMGVETEEGSKDYLFLLLNLGFLLLVTGLAKWMHRHDDYFAFDGLYTKLLKQEAAHEQKIQKIQTAVAAKEEEIERKWLGDAQRHLDEVRANERAEIDNCKSIIAAFRIYLKRQSISLSDIYQNAIVELRTNIIFAREREGLAAISFDAAPIKALDFDKGIDLSDIYKKSSNSDTTIPPQPSRNGVHKGFTTIALLVACFLFSSCANEQPPPPISKTIAYVSDWSIDKKDADLLPSTEAQLLFLFKTAGFAPTAVSADGINFLTAHIGTTSLAPVYRCSLSQGSSNMVKAQRRKQQRAFGGCVYEKVKMQNIQQGLEQSFVGATLQQILPPLARSDDSLKICLFASDMVLNNKNVVNFYRYGSQLMENYSSIADKIEKAYPALKDIDLNGVKFYAAYLPNKKTDKIAKATRLFWTKWFASKNASIEFLPNLVEPRLAAQQ